MTIFYTSINLRNQKIHIRGINNGERFQDIVTEYCPYLFLPDPKGEYTTVTGKRCRKIEFESIREGYNASNAYRENRLEYYGMTNWIYPYLNEYFPDGFEYDTKQISIVSLDIEVSSRQGFPNVEKAEDEITAITLVKNGISYTLSYGDYVAKENQIYFKCHGEVHLLNEFLRVYHKLDPDIVTGWAIEKFDIPYLVHRLERILGEKSSRRLSPWKYIEAKEIIRGKTTESASLDQRKDIVYIIDGVTVLDYLDLYKKFSFQNHESYALKFISQHVLGRTKVEYDGTLDELYDNDFQKFIEYNIEDALLVHDMEKKLDFINRVIVLAYLAKVNYADALKATRMWDAIIHNWLLKKKVVVPQSVDKDERELKAAYVKETHPRMYNWVVSFDYDSLYPSIISQHNISPDTFIKKIDAPDPEEMVKNDLWPAIQDGVISSGNGALFLKDTRGFLPAVVDEYLQRRKKVRKDMMELKKKDENDSQVRILDGFQHALKILNNSLYGSISMKHFRWFNIDLAEAVTFTAQTCTRYMIRRIDEFLNKALGTEGIEFVIASDTDSVYVELGEVVKARWPNELPEKKVIIEFVDKFCEEVLRPCIVKTCEDLNKNFNTSISKLNMKREVIADRAIWRAKKMYILNVWDEEGSRYEKPKLKIRGIEVVRSNIPLICRNKIRDTLKIIFNKEQSDLHKYVKDFKEEYFQLPFPTIATPSSLNDGLSKYYDPVKKWKKYTPMHVRAALVYNEAIKELGLQKKYRLIKSREKIKYCYLKEPNIFHSNVIACHENLPSEFELDDYIDRNQQWEKKFIAPIKSITDIIGWNIEPISTLEDFLPE